MIASHDFVPCPMGRRFLAFVLDMAIVSFFINIIFAGAAFALFYKLGATDPDDLALRIQLMEFRDVVFIVLGLIFCILLSAAIWHVYFVYFEHVYRKTPGKKVFALEVVSTNGEALTLKQCVLREVFRCYVDMLFILPGFISMLCTRKKQRLGDLASDTLVVFSQNRADTERFLYLTKTQFDLASKKYKVLDASLEEANSFLKNIFPLLYAAPEENVENNTEFLLRVLQAQEPTQEDSRDYQLRYLAEYLLSQRRAP
ncbi:MAG: RDD family protein [Bdellovibrionota bacterium]